MPEGQKKTGGARVRLVEVLIGAVCAGGGRLERVRSEFGGMDPAASLRRLVLQAVDPELLSAVLGPRLAPRWVAPLRAQYSRFQQAYPADWVDVEKVWREQRARWRPGDGASGGAQAAARAYPARGAAGQGRGGLPRSVRPSRAVPAPQPRAAKAARPHRPVPAGVAPAHDDDVDSVAAPADEVVSGVVGDAAAEDSAGVGRRGTGPSDPPVAERVNGAPADPPLPPRAAGSRPRPRQSGPASSGDGRIELSGRVGELVERLLKAMAHSQARVESVRRVWIDAPAAPGGWDLWALDPAVIDSVRAIQRGVER